MKEVWHSKIPTMIKNFICHMIRGRLPSSDNIWKRHVPSNGECILCEEFEESNHIFFQCTLAKFMRACVRVLLGCDWNRFGVVDLTAILQSLMGRTCRIIWICVVAMRWSLWNMRTKITIEKKFISQLADYLKNDHLSAGLEAAE
jgi:hypothetical protein